MSKPKENYCSLLKLLCETIMDFMHEAIGQSPPFSSGHHNNAKTLSVTNCFQLSLSHHHAVHEDYWRRRLWTDMSFIMAP